MTASRAYKLEAGEPLPDGIARIARGRIDHATDELSGDTDSSPEEAVHEARKDLKKLRALLRLTRGELGESVFARENTCYRDAARELSGVRDADVMLETLKVLDLPTGLGWELRKKVQAHHSLQCADGREAAAQGVVEMLNEARGRIDDWPVECDSFGALADGLERTYRRGRRGLRRALDKPTVEGLHDWRKRVKELWYHHTVLRCAWPPVMAAVGDEAHELSDRLGDDHDLALLAEWVSEHVGEEPKLNEAVVARREALRSQALTLGGRLYAEKPSAYIVRLRRLWEADRARIRAP